MPAAPHTLSEALMRAFSLSTCLLLAVAPAIHAQGALATNQTPMHWGPAPAVFPPGARMAVVSGDPSKAAVFTVQLAMRSEERRVGKECRAGGSQYHQGQKERRGRHRIAGETT